MAQPVQRCAGDLPRRSAPLLPATDVQAKQPRDLNELRLGYSLADDPLGCFLRDRQVLKRLLEKILKDRNFIEILSSQALAVVLGDLSQHLRLKADVFGDADRLLHAFDLDGSGALDHEEFYLLAKSCLRRLELPDLCPKLLRTVLPSVTSPEEAGYKVGIELARGGQGAVYWASHTNPVTNTQRVVALKKYDKRNRNAATVDEIVHEAHVLMELIQHPNITRCYEIFQSRIHFIMVNEYLAGGDWRKVRKLAREQGVTADLRWHLNLFSQAWEGIAFIHKNGVVHCDIKEDNIMLRDVDMSKPEVVIIDFGLAVHSVEPDHFCGTPGYIPPESWSDNCWHPKGDVFAMGVVCLQMCLPQEQDKQKKVFKGSTLAEYRNRVETYSPQKELSEMQPESDELQQLLRHCLEKEEPKRWQAAQVLRDDIFPRASDTLSRRIRTPAFTEDAVLQPMDLVAVSFEVEIDASQDRAFGFRVCEVPERRALFIEHVSSEGLIAEWNKQPEREQQVTPGCEIIEVLGAKTPDSSSLKMALKRPEMKRLRVRAAPVHPVVFCCPFGDEATLGSLLGALHADEAFADILAFRLSAEGYVDGKGMPAFRLRAEGPYVDGKDPYAEGPCVVQARLMGKVMVIELGLKEVLKNMEELSSWAKCVLYSPSVSSAKHASTEEDEWQLANAHRLRFAAVLEQASPEEAAEQALTHLKEWFPKRLGERLY